MTKINKLNNICRVLFMEVNGNLVLGTDYTDYMDSLKGLPCHPVVEGSHVAHTQYNMRCLDKLDMTDTIRLRKSV